MKFSDVRGPEAFGAAGNVLTIAGRILANKNNAKMIGHNLFEFFGAVAQNTPAELQALIEARTGEKIADEDFTANRVIDEIGGLIADDGISRLFS